MNFRKTTQEDLDYMVEHSVSRGIQKYQPEQIDFCYTLEHDNKVLGIGGFRLINLTTAWCWVNMADCSENHTIAGYRVLKEWIDIFIEEHNLKRLQAYVECDFPEAIRMVKHLGFHWESTMPYFVGDKSADMYSRII